MFNMRHALPMSLGRSLRRSAITLLFWQGFITFFQGCIWLHQAPWQGWHTSSLNGSFLLLALLFFLTLMLPCRHSAGVGKTTLTNNIAAFIADSMQKRVLVVDCDPQCNTTQLLMGQEFATELYWEQTPP